MAGAGPVVRIAVQVRRTLQVPDDQVQVRGKYQATLVLQRHRSCQCPGGSQHRVFLGLAQEVLEFL